MTGIEMQTAFRSTEGKSIVILRPTEPEPLA